MQRLLATTLFVIVANAHAVDAPDPMRLIGTINGWLERPAAVLAHCDAAGLPGKEARQARLAEWRVSYAPLIAKADHELADAIRLMLPNKDFDPVRSVKAGMAMRMEREDFLSRTPDEVAFICSEAGKPGFPMWTPARAEMIQDRLAQLAQWRQSRPAASAPAP